MSRLGICLWMTILTGCASDQPAETNPVAEVVVNVRVETTTGGWDTAEPLTGTDLHLQVGEARWLLVDAEIATELPRKYKERDLQPVDAWIVACVVRDAANLAGDPVQWIPMNPLAPGQGVPSGSGRGSAEAHAPALSPKKMVTNHRYYVTTLAGAQLPPGTYAYEITFYPAPDPAPASGTIAPVRRYGDPLVAQTGKLIATAVASASP